MVRILGVACTLFAFLFLLNAGTEGAVNQKPQMVKGTIKEVQVDKNVLVVNQKVKNDFVDRELSIETTTEFVLKKKGSDDKTGTGAEGLKLLDGANAKGANVQVKCDKDVKVLRVTVMLK
jgi:hypothetical protein